MIETVTARKNSHATLTELKMQVRNVKASCKRKHNEHIAAV